MRNFFSVNQKNTKWSALLLLAAALAGLAGCGGGSPGGAGGAAGGATGGGTGTGGAASTTPTLTLALVDSAGAASTALTLGAPLTLQATLKDASGAAMPNVVISFASGDPSLAVVSPPSGLTNAAGVAFSRIDAASIAAVGANYANATATFPAGAATTAPAQASTPFSVGAAAVNLTLTVSQPSISAYGTSSVAATVTVNGAVPASPMTVQFTSGCVSSGKATMSTNVQTVNGVATATYTDIGCAQTDTVVASVGSAQKSGTIAVAAPQAANIQFVSTTPNSLLVLKGTGGIGYSETAVVQFKVVDASSAGIANQTVNFGLTTSAGGITLDGVALGVGSTITKQTDVTGAVSVTVQSGTLPTAVWVTAALGTLSTQSNRLVISTGRPTQDFFSLSATTLNIDGGNYDGATTTLTVRAADRLGNIVADGTAINFITEGAQIIGQAAGGASSSTCSTVNGSCTVTLVSAAFRPNPDSEPSGLATANRVTVLAYTLGEESFVDANGNNRWDAGEAWDDLGNVFIDANENKAWAAPEQFIQYLASNTAACPALPASGKLDNAPSKPATCDGVWGQAHVRRGIVIALSGNQATTDIAGALSMGNSCSKSFVFRLKDQFGNPMPLGTSISFPTIGVADTPTGAPPTFNSAVVSVQPDSVQNTNAAGGTFHTLTLTFANGACNKPIVAGQIAMKITTPAGTSNTTTLIPITITN